MFSNLCKTKIKIKQKQKPEKTVKKNNSEKQWEDWQILIDRLIDRPRPRQT